MRKFRGLIQSNRKPIDTQMLWLYKGKIHYYNDGQWVLLDGFYPEPEASSQYPQILTYGESGYEWNKLNLDELTTCTLESGIYPRRLFQDPSRRVTGNLSILDKVAKLFRPCIITPEGVQYYLNPNDWTKKEDGTPSRLDGYLALLDTIKAAVKKDFNNEEDSTLILQK